MVEKAVTNASRQERQLLINEVLENEYPLSNLSSSTITSTESSPVAVDTTGDTSVLWTMMKDQFANYVVQKMLDVSEQPIRKELMTRIRPYLNSLRKYNYGKHIINKMEKYHLKAGSSHLPLFSPSSSTGNHDVASSLSSGASSVGGSVCGAPLNTSATDWQSSGGAAGINSPTMSFGFGEGSPLTHFAQSLSAVCPPLRDEGDEEADTGDDEHRQSSESETTTTAVNRGEFSDT